MELRDAAGDRRTRACYRSTMSATMVTRKINQTLFANQYPKKGFQGLPTSLPDPRFGEIRELGQPGIFQLRRLGDSIQMEMDLEFHGQLSPIPGAMRSIPARMNAWSRFNAPAAAWALGASGTRSVHLVRGPQLQQCRLRCSPLLNANYVYTLPNSYFHNWLTKGVLGGWTVAGTVLLPQRLSVQHCR